MGRKEDSNLPASGDFRGLLGEVTSLPLDTLGRELSDSVPVVNLLPPASTLPPFAFSLPPFSFLNFLRQDLVRLKSPSPVSESVALYSEHSAIRLLYSLFSIARAYNVTGNAIDHVMQIIKGCNDNQKLSWIHFL